MTSAIIPNSDLPPSKPIDARASDKASDILSALGHATFDWDLATGAMKWSSNAASVFDGIPSEALVSAAEFSKLIEPAQSARSDAAQNIGPESEGASYQIEYGLRATTSADLLWVEETGHRVLCEDGRPTHICGVVRINNDRRAREEQLLKLSKNDPLTGELNRQHLVASLAEAMEETARFRSSFAFMLIGVDHLARLNDAFGFDIADEVILEIAKRIRARLRGGDILGRFSGNKFGLILKNCTVDDMNIAAERFLAGVRDEVVPTRSGPVAVTATIGAINAPRHARTTEEAMSRTQERSISLKAAGADR